MADEEAKNNQGLEITEKRTENSQTTTAISAKTKPDNTKNGEKQKGLEFVFCRMKRNP